MAKDVGAHRRETSVGIGIALLLVLIYYTFMVAANSGLARFLEARLNFHSEDPLMFLNRVTICHPGQVIAHRSMPAILLGAFA